jgi:hypothetical protein
MDYHHLRVREPRITLPSVLLLAVFVAAAAFIVSAIVWQPWNTDGAAVITPPTEDAVTEEPAPSDLGGLDVVVQPPAE